MPKAGKTGVSTETPKRILFGAGTIHKGLKYTPGELEAPGTWNFTESLIGATNGGSTLTITPEVTTVEADGAWVATKGLKVKTGETATIEVNMAELTPDILKAAVLGAAGTSADTTYDVIESKAAIEAGDYWENIAFVGQTLEGKNIIVILDNALCTSGMELGGESKGQVTPALTFECHADINDDLDTLPYHIYYPKQGA